MRNSYLSTLLNKSVVLTFTWNDLLSKQKWNCLCALELKLEFYVQGSEKQFDLPVKKKEDICTIMYTSGTTGDPKGVLISNTSIVTLIAGVKRLLGSVNESVMNYFLFLFMPFDVNHSYGVGLII